MKKERFLEIYDTTKKPNQMEKYVVSQIGWYGIKMQPHNRRSNFENQTNEYKINPFQGKVLKNTAI